MIEKEVMQEDEMSKYRLCVIDDAGHVVDVFEPECSSDEEAFNKAEALVDGRAIDIWAKDEPDGERWIAWLDGKDPLRIALLHHDVTPH
jgi:hypothetical protein